MTALIEQLDGDEAILVFGSDYPHPGGVAEAAHFAEPLTTLAPDVQRRIMRGNAEKIFSLT